MASLFELFASFSDCAYQLAYYRAFQEHFLEYYKQYRDLGYADEAEQLGVEYFKLIGSKEETAVFFGVPETVVEEWLQKYGRGDECINRALEDGTRQGMTRGKKNAEYWVNQVLCECKKPGMVPEIGPEDVDEYKEYVHNPYFQTHFQFIEQEWGLW